MVSPYLTTKECAVTLLTSLHNALHNLTHIGEQ